jgi:hypothetical protein
VSPLERLAVLKIGRKLTHGGGERSGSRGAVKFGRTGQVYSRGKDSLLMSVVKWHGLRTYRSSLSGLVDSWSYEEDIVSCGFQCLVKGTNVGRGPRVIVVEEDV